MPPLSRRSFLAGSTALAALSPRLQGLVALENKVADAGGPPKFKLGLVTYNVAAGWDLPTTLKVCKEVGIAAVECRTTHKHGVEPALGKEERAGVKRQFADSGVAFWGCGSVCEFHSADAAVVEKNVEQCKRFIGLVAELGGIGVKVRPNGVTKGGDLAATLDRIGKALRECGRAAAEAGIIVSMEVHGAITSLPKNSRAIMDACGHPAVGVTWNSNGTDVVKGSVAEGFELLKPFIRSCHINDLTNDAAGKYPYRELFALLKGIGYDRYTMCEVGKSYDPVAGAEFLKGYKKLWTQLANG